ncbi:TetR family transcriptional regulator [Nocardia sp. NPDC057272]|uniref:TetR family transcriptional regulator n=1 Tax=Nocardia sp. NPDC057272 TaxID=3346079 RepID=UPI0036419E3A
MVRPAGRRKEILESFIRHVAEYGYERTNLGDIAKELGMSKGTIVHHFGTKAQMLCELEENYMNHQLDAVRSMWERLAKPQERIAAIVFASAILQVVARDATVASQREVVQLADDPGMQEVRKLRRELQRMTEEELRRGIDEGLFRPVDVEVVSLQLWGSVQWMWVWFQPGGRHTPEAIGSTFVDVLLGGLLVDRFGLSALSDTNGEVATVVRETFAAGAGK